MMTSSQAKEAIRDWVLTKTTKITRDELTSGTPLIETRLVTSLQLMELLVKIEAMREAPLDIENLKPGTFNTIDTMVKAFWPEEGADA
jgi:hypothetical protein